MLNENIIHPKRILIMTALFIFRKMTESELAKVTGIDWGSLSTHLSRLERIGYIERKKGIVNCRIRTVVSITEKGYKAYIEEIEKLRKLISHPEESLQSPST